MKELQDLIKEFNDLGITSFIDYEKFNLYSLVHHSTTIEGATLTEVETQLLLEENLTPKGKPLDHSLMVTDDFKALVYTLKESATKANINIELIKKINSLVMANTGKVYNTVFGTIDSSEGHFRKANVFAGSSYFPSYDKVVKLMDDLVKKTQII